MERRIIPPFLNGRKYEGRKRGGVRGGNRSVDRRYGIARAAAKQATDADRYGAVDPDRKGKKKNGGKEEIGGKKMARARARTKTKQKKRASDIAAARYARTN